MLATGTRAPEFTLPDQTGRDRTLTELLSGGLAILYFYPADFTPGCTREACAFRDMHAQIARTGMTIVGISPQAPATHAAFRNKYQLPFDLLSDQDKSVIKMYGANGPLGFGVRRITYLIDSGRRIRASVKAHFAISKHEDFIRRALLLRQASMVAKPAAKEF
jgi:thioredoxin-dependent peroxiredoxin